MSVKYNGKHLAKFIRPEEYDTIFPQVELAHQQLESRSGAGNDFLGWLDLPVNYDKEEFARIKEAAKKIREDSDVLLVAGIGGSYLGARAVVEAVKGLYHNDTEDGLKIYFCGNTISPTYLNDIIKVTKGKRFSINVISKSGTTTETSIAFRLLRELLIKKIGVEASRKAIFATTDKEKGALKTMADAEGYESFVVPDDVGGRYSVLTAVGLLPIAVAGIDIQQLMEGAADARAAFQTPGMDNPVWQYAAARNALYQAGKKIEILGCYDSAFRFMAEWWKQLYGESEGKEGKGIFPASVEFTADLHSMGQYIQEGERQLFETIVNFERSRGRILVPGDRENLDGLNFLTGKDLKFLCEQARLGTRLAHVDGGVPNLTIQVQQADAYHVGGLLYFFELACGLSGYLLGVNPFDQPGVEAYKKNMFALLGKPGYETLGETLRKRL